MRHFKLLLFLSFLIPPPSFGQNACECTSVFDEAVAMVEEVYAGFRDKVTETTQEVYEQRKVTYRGKSSEINNAKDCHRLMLDFLDFYNDNHIIPGFKLEANPENQRIIPIDETQINALLTKNTAWHPLEGVWQSEDGQYKYAIIPDSMIKSGYAMIALKYPENIVEKGTVKMEFIDKAIGNYQLGYFYNDDFSISYSGFTLQDDVLDMHTHKVFKQNNGKPQSFEHISNEVILKKINEATYYLRLPVFNHYEVKLLDSLLTANEHDIRSMPNLIIDIRNNGGGDDVTPNSLLQILYTDTIKNPYWDYRASDPYLSKLEKRLKEGKVQKSRYERYQNAKGGYWREDAEIITFDSTYAYPKNIAVLMNEGCASSAEFFIHYAKQSRKVTLFGSPSSGTMDYGPTDNFPLACEYFVFSIPFGRNGWVDTKPIDKAGFYPDVEIPSSTHWVNFVLDYWKKNKK